MDDIPFGPGVLYSGEGANRCRHLTRLASSEDVHGNALDRQASLFIQYLALERFPNAKLVASGIHAGPGEICFGADRRQRADVTLVPEWGRILVANYHGGFWHYHGHFKRCPLDAGGGVVMEPDTVKADVFKTGYAKALSAVAKRGAGRAIFEYRAFVECDFFHGRRSFKARKTGKTYTQLRHLLQAEHGQDAVLGSDKAAWGSDELVKAIVEEEVHGFVAVAGGRETVRDKVSHLFSFVPQRSTVSADEVGEATRRQIDALYGPGSAKAASVLEDYTQRAFTLTKSYADLRGAGVLVMSTTLFRWLLQHRAFSGFEIRHFLAYAYRDYLQPYLLNNLRARQAERAKPGGGSALMSEALKLISNSYYGYLGLQPTNYPKTRLCRGSTLCRQPVERLRKMQSLALVGCVPERPSKARQTSQAAHKRKAREQVRQRLLKRRAEEETRRQSRADTEAFSSTEEEEEEEDEDEEAEVEGAGSGKAKENDAGLTAEIANAPTAPRLELLYAATSANPNAKIRNLIQVSAAILSNSKRIYFSHVFFLLDHLSSKEVEKCYFDTDSCILAAHRYNLQDMVAYGKEESFAAGLDKVLYTPGSGREPFGLFKYDARATRGLFHSPKCYLLRGPPGNDDDDTAADEERREGPGASLPVEEVKRFKGCSRGVQKALLPEHFALDLVTGLSQPAFANRSRLASTTGFQMLVREESRRLVSPVNLKRRYDVRPNPNPPV